MPTYDSERNLTNRSWRLYAVVSEWVIGALGLAAIGWWIDSHYGSFPWWTLGLGLTGTVVGLANLIRAGFRAFRQETHRDERADERSEP